MIENVITADRGGRAWVGMHDGHTCCTRCTHPATHRVRWERYLISDLTCGVHANALVEKAGRYRAWSEQR